MVIDTSALLAILLDEPERHAFNEALEAADRTLLSAASYVEASILLESRRGPEAAAALDTFLAKADIEIHPVDRAQAQAARDAFRRFGKGRHAAGLNFGDCFAYALAYTLAEPLLFKGEDFGRTDVLIPDPPGLQGLA
jgi:ribonuclease VapC